MTREQATRYAREELDKHNLKDWSVRLNPSATNFKGMCSYKDKCIILSGLHIDINPDVAIRNTILHEIAHALVGATHGHDDVWRLKAAQIGCDDHNPCTSFNLPPHAIDAIRSGATVEVTYEEHTQVTRIPKYKVTRLQDHCPECGKVAVELFRSEVKTKEGDTKILISLECFHVITKTIPRGTPFHEMVSNFWKDDVKTCKHDWNKTQCKKCNQFKLYDFQITGARAAEVALATGKGFGIFDEMGLGKTVQDLAVIKYHKEFLPVLYVLKSGIKFQWQAEIVRWLGPDYIPQVIESSHDFVLPGMKGYIISYDLLRRFDRETINKIGIKLVVLDECQQIKNPDSTRTKEVRRIVGNENVKVIGLSGTPWKNRGSELFPIFNMLDPIKFPSYERFVRDWVNYYWQGTKRKEGGIRNVERFKEYVKDIMIRRERIEVMKELPLINRTKLNFQLEGLNKEAYEEEEGEFAEWYNEQVMGGEEDKIDGLALVAQMAKMRHIVGLAKIPATLAYAEDFIENTDRKLVIFVHHKDVGHTLYSELNNKFGKEIPVEKLTADLTSEDRYNLQVKFNNAPRMILVASTLASGEGLNLQTCSDCVMHERQWNPANEEQAEGRFIRIGQTSTTVSATYVEADKTVDLDVDAIVERKRVYIHELMSKAEIPVWNQGEVAKEMALAIVERVRKKNSGKKLAKVGK